MHVAQVLDGIGVITGSAPDDVRHTLAEVDGVASVDEQLTHQLPPPDAARPVSRRGRPQRRSRTRRSSSGPSEPATTWSATVVSVAPVRRA